MEGTMNVQWTPEQVAWVAILCFLIGLGCGAVIVLGVGGGS
jgi:hypothetical protein